MPLLQVNNLKTWFHTRNGIARAVDGVSFDLERGETLGIVGESGSGKSVTCYSLLGLIPKPPGRIESGSAMFGDIDLLQSSEKVLRKIRGKRISIIFQDPMTSLNPFLKIGTQLIEPLLLHTDMKKKQAIRTAVEALEEVGIQDASRRIQSYPHEFSGGMRQRVMIAMALITNPEILIADEPSTALDVTVQAQILRLIKKRQEELGIAVIFITHDLGVVAGMCDRVNVMYAGRFVESGFVDMIYEKPVHPYSRALQRSIPALHKKNERLYTIAGTPPDLMSPVKGCVFAERCEFSRDDCFNGEMMISPLDDQGHATACRRILTGDLDPESLRKGIV